ncbi:hypothetical protein IWQ62_001557 [Dispira parvispora]|uniref:Uncharacterized protein n=1 Tax=Dispira parvispora TaxID=1520584 RepID=A0A9W8E4T2_9FUNG|nr:hypothetical protein IWQ62_001557 [Dispira parvispora]
MSEYDTLRKGNKLSFKGDAKKRKKAKSSKRKQPKGTPAQGEFHGHSSEERIAPPASTHSTWVPVESLADFEGPTSIFFNSEPVRCLVAVDDSETLQAQWALDDADQPFDATKSAYPTSLQQVFIVRLIPNTDSGIRSHASSTSKSVSIKTSNGHYVSCARDGTVVTDSMAVGPQEMWTPILRPDGVSFQSIYDSFLTLPIDTQTEGSRKSLTLCCTDDGIGFRQVFDVKCQSQLRDKRKLEDDAQDASLGGDLEKLERDQIRKYQGWGGGGRSHPVTTVDPELKRARKTGHVAGALLSRREKLKSDKYCK